MMKVGWGKLVEWKEEGGTIILRAKDLWSSRALRSAIRRLEYPSCSIEAGLFCGIIEAATRKRYEVEELRCETKGDKYCEFILKVSE